MHRAGQRGVFGVVGRLGQVVRVEPHPQMIAGPRRALANLDIAEPLGNLCHAGQLVRVHARTGLVNLNRIVIEAHADGPPQLEVPARDAD